MVVVVVVVIFFYCKTSNWLTAELTFKHLKVPPQFDCLLVLFEIRFAKIQTYLISTTTC